jgi:hypothetical protein
MSGWRRVLVVGAAVLVAGALSPGTAWAGGPTSVLLASPQTDRAAALYDRDPAYQQLGDLLGSDPQPDPAPPPPDNGTTYVTVTWLIHDVDVWRIDRVFLDTSTGPWVVTQQADGVSTTAVSTDLWPNQRGGPDAIWHRPGDPGALLALFTDLGLLRPAGEQSVAQTVHTPVAAPPPAPAPAPAPAEGDGLWWWAGAGALVGAGLTVTGLRGSARLRRQLLAAAR